MHICRPTKKIACVCVCVSQSHVNVFSNLHYFMKEPLIKIVQIALGIKV